MTFLCRFSVRIGNLVPSTLSSVMPKFGVVAAFKAPFHKQKADSLAGTAHSSDNQRGRAETAWLS